MNGWKQLHRFSNLMTPWQWAVVIVTISLAIWSILRIRSYFREDAEDTDDALEMLTQFRELHQEGGLSDDEFRLIKRRLTSSQRATSVSEQTDPQVHSVESNQQQLTVTPTESNNQSTSPHTTTEKMETSGRMTDDELK